MNVTGSSRGLEVTGAGAGSCRTPGWCCRGGQSGQSSGWTLVLQAMRDGFVLRHRVQPEGYLGAEREGVIGFAHAVVAFILGQWTGSGGGYGAEGLYGPVRARRRQSATHLVVRSPVKQVHGMIETRMTRGAARVARPGSSA